MKIVVFPYQILQRDCKMDMHKLKPRFKFAKKYYIKYLRVYALSGQKKEENYLLEVKMELSQFGMLKI